MDISFFVGGVLMFLKMFLKVNTFPIIYIFHIKTCNIFCLDLSHSDTRLSVQLNGFELHIYNRSDLYDQLERTFGLQPSVLIPVTINKSKMNFVLLK